MQSLDPRTPIIVGAGQFTQLPGSGSLNPLELMVEGARAAAADAGPGGESLLQAIDEVAIVNVFSWGAAKDPGSALAAELGLKPKSTSCTVIGGNSPILLLGDVATRIAAGEIDSAILGAAEAGLAFMRGDTQGWPQQSPDARPDRLLGSDQGPSHEAEFAAGLMLPIHYYPLIEHALRHKAGRSVNEQQEWIASWWAGYSEVAAAHPYAWHRQPVRAEDVLSTENGNRLINDPYFRCMNADINVDQAAMLLVTTVENAQKHGIPEDRWVYLHATSACGDHWFVGERDDFAASPAIAANARAVYSHAQIGPGEIDFVDLYSCFPCAVQIAANELGLKVDEPGRPLTVTGGLNFFGGPANNYVTHALATLVQKCREDRGALALSSAVGWYMTKHGLALLSGVAPKSPYAHFDPQAEVDALPKREIVEQATGTWQLESYTASYDRDGNPVSGSISVLSDDGKRAFASTRDSQVLATLILGESIGVDVRLDGSGGFSL